MYLGLAFGRRFANGIASYWRYLGHTIWPVDLAIFFPHPDARYPISQQWPAWLIVAAAVSLAGVSVLTFVGRRRTPWLTMGWFWYVGTMLPAIGIIQVGGQAMADRYSYVPLIGIFVAAL